MKKKDTYHTKKLVVSSYVLPNMGKKIYPQINEYERDREYERQERRAKKFKDEHNCLFFILFLCFPIMYICSKCSKNRVDINNDVDT